MSEILVELGESAISDSQALHLNSIIPDMKPLILILLVGVWVQAQTIADFARQERERQARLQSTRVVTTEDIKSADLTPAPAATTGAPAEKAPEAQAAVPAPATKAPAGAAPATTATESAKPDPVKEWNEEMARVRAQIRQLQDRETATQLRINDLTNQVYAPVTTQAARNQAQTALGDAQKQLTSVREEIIKTRLKLEQMEAQGPPNK